MTAVYQWCQDYDQFQFFVLKKDSPDDIVFLDGSSKRATWKPPLVTIERAVLGLRKGDLWNFGSGAPILTERAVVLLREHLEAAGELLPMSYRKERYWVFNVTSTVDCLDFDKTVVEYLDGPTGFVRGSISDAYKGGEKESLKLCTPVFDPGKLGTTIFTVPQNTTYLFVRDEFKTAVEQAELLGFRFEEVWRVDLSSHR